jgi:hypothetical protein
MARNRHYSDRSCAGRIQGSERGEEFHRSFGKIALAAEIDGRTGKFRRIGPEGEERLAVMRCHHIESQLHLRRVMTLQLTGRADFGFRPRHGETATQDLLDLFARQRAHAKQHGLVADDAHDGRFQSAGTRSSIEDHGGNLAKLGLDMFGQRRADPP